VQRLHKLSGPKAASSARNPWKSLREGKDCGQQSNALTVPLRGPLQWRLEPVWSVPAGDRIDVLRGGLITIAVPRLYPAALVESLYGIFPILRVSKPFAAGDPV
jgi:hypothetical protein